MKITIDLATQTDIPAISQLLEANSASQQGQLFGDFPLHKTTNMYNHALKVITARDTTNIIGVIFASSPKGRQPDIIQTLLANYPASANTYLYGPACIAETHRGQGLLANMYHYLQKQLPNQTPLLFINQNNIASLKAHHKLGFKDKQYMNYQDQTLIILTD